MRHIDDGILHAYLDGALDAVADAGELPAGVTTADVREHLESCGDCSARLAQERAVKERAGRVLQDAGAVDIDVPPFSQLERRPGAQHAGASRRPRRRWLPMTWAATVLLALGAGWWGSVLWRSEPQQLSDAGMVEAPSAIEASSAAQQDRSTEPTGEGDVAMSTDQPPAAQQATSAESARPSSIPSAPSPLADAGAATGADADASVQSELRTRASDEQVAPTAAAAAAAPPPPLAQTDAARLEPGWTLLDQLETARADSAVWTVLGANTVDTLSAVVVAGAGPPTFASAPPAVGTGPLVRVRQQLGGRLVELVYSQPTIQSPSEFKPVAPAMGLSARTGAAGAAGRSEAAANEASVATLAVDVVSSRQHPDGTSEIVVRVADTGAFVVLRGAMPPDELARVAARLVRR